MRTLDNMAALSIGLTLCFFVVYASTALYTSSSSFWVSKVSALLLNFVALLAPVVCFRSAHSIVFVRNILIALGIFAATVVMIVYQAGLLDLLLNKNIYSDDISTPDYLVLSMVIGVAAIFLLSSHLRFSYFLAFFCFLSMLLLTGRGPLLFFVMISFFILAPRFSSARLSRKFNALLLLVILGVGAGSWQGVEGIVDRFSALFLGEGLASAFRLEDIQISKALISENILSGVGIGGYGMSGFSSDENAYPHNLFLESFVEAGLLGFFMFSVSISIFFMGCIVTLNRKFAIPYMMVFLFIFLNYMKSGGFIGARDLYFFAGLALSVAAHEKRSQRVKQRIQL